MRIICRWVPKRLWSRCLQSGSSIRCVDVRYPPRLNILRTSVQILVGSFEIWGEPFLMKDGCWDTLLSQRALWVPHVANCWVVNGSVMESVVLRRNGSAHAPKIGSLFIWSVWLFFFLKRLFDLLVSWLDKIFGKLRGWLWSWNTSSERLRIRVCELRRMFYRRVLH